MRGTRRERGAARTEVRERDATSEEEDEREREREGREHAASQRETQRTTEGLSAWRAGHR